MLLESKCTLPDKSPASPTDTTTVLPHLNPFPGSGLAGKHIFGLATFIFKKKGREGGKEGWEKRGKEKKQTKMKEKKEDSKIGLSDS